MTRSGTAGSDLVVLGQVHGASAVGPGFVAISGGIVTVVETGGVDPAALIGPGTVVLDAHGGSVLPGLHDNHVFTTSALLDHGGTDARRMRDDDALATVRSQDRTVLRVEEPARAAELVDRCSPRGDCEVLDVVVIATGRAEIAATAAARRRLGDLDPASNESLHGLYAQLSEDGAAVRAALSDVAARMIRGGVVSLKDIVFDDSPRLLDSVEEVLADGTFPLRYAYTSQPVARPADLELGGRARRHPGRARFSGYKLMTDGSFDEGTADLLPDGGERPTRRDLDGSAVDYDALAVEARRILEAGFPLALNADGDGAARRCLDIFEERSRRRPLPTGCTLSDASIVSDADAARLAALGVGVEAYTQLLRYPGYSSALLDGLLPGGHARHLGNFRRMVEAGVVVTSGTDYPLFRPSLPEAILSAAERRLGQGTPRETWFPGNALTRQQVIDAWTVAPARQLATAAHQGVLAVGRRADLTVFGVDLLTAPAEALVGCAPILVAVDGRVVSAR